MGGRGGGGGGRGGASAGVSDTNQISMGTVEINGKARDLVGTTKVKTAADGSTSIEIGISAKGYKKGDQIGFVQFGISADGKTAKIKYIESSKALKGQKVGERLYGAAMQTAKRRGASEFNSDFRLSASAVRAWDGIKGKLGSAVTKTKGAVSTATETTSFNTGRPLFSVNLSKVSQTKLDGLGK